MTLDQDAAPVVGVFPDRAAAELAIVELKRAGFDLSRLGESMDRALQREDVERYQLHVAKGGAVVIVTPQGRSAEAVTILRRNGAEEINENRGGLDVNGDEERSEWQASDVDVDTPYGPPQRQTPQDPDAMGVAGAGRESDEASATGLTGAPPAGADTSGVTGTGLGENTSDEGLTGSAGAPSVGQPTGLTGASVGSNEASQTGLVGGEADQQSTAAGDARDASDADPANYAIGGRALGQRPNTPLGAPGEPTNGTLPPHPQTDEEIIETGESQGL
ncbi:MAG TPA: hypothetical protein VKQ36_08860 [Ktedonobacterales bacterium]|nr:hypothetical protein [Ktedonobacterales bacterium]